MVSALVPLLLQVLMTCDWILVTAHALVTVPPLGRLPNGYLDVNAGHVGKKLRTGYGNAVLMCEWVRHFALSAGAHGVPGLLSPNKCRTPGDLATSGQSLLSPRKCQGKKHDMFTIALWEFYVRFEAGLLWAGWAGWAGATPTSFSEGWRGRWVVLGAEIPPGSFASRGSTKTGQDVGLAGLLWAGWVGLAGLLGAGRAARATPANYCEFGRHT